MIAFQKRKMKTVFESIGPLLFLSRIAGVCTLIKKRTHEKDELIRSNFMTVLQVLILLISIAHLGFIPYAVINIEQMPDISSQINKTLTHSGSLNSQKFITKMANIVLISTTAILVRLINLIQMPRHLPDLLKDIQILDRIVTQQDNTDFKRMAILSFILVLVSWPYQIYSILIVTTDSWMAFLMFYLNLYNNFSVISCEFQFIALCWIIESRYDKLNQGLEDLSTKNYIENADASLTKLSISKKCSKILTDAFLKLNKLQGLQLMVVLSGLCLNVLFGLYFSIFGGFTKNSKKTSLSFQRISNVMNEVLWSFYYLIRFVFLCVTAGLLTDKANTPKKLICSILDKTKSEPLKEKLWIYLSYSITNKLYFTASGFFKINKALITSAVSIGTTYLVILAQFQKK